MKTRHKLQLVLFVAFAALGAFATAGTLLVMSPALKVATSGAAAIGGPFALVATSGETVTDQTYRGRWLLIFFGYTSCPDACPTALNNISVALETLGPDAIELQPLFVTVDPRRDTPDVMTEYMKSFNSRILGLTGTQAEIDRVIKEYRIYVAAEKTEGDDYLISHSAYIYLMDPQGTFVNVIQGNEAGERVAAWIRKEMAHPDR